MRFTIRAGSICPILAEMNRLRTPGKLHNIGERKREFGSVNKKKPVAAPGLVSCNEAISRYIQRDIFMQPGRRNVFDRHLSGLMQRRCHRARWRLDLVLTGPNPSHVPKRPHQTDRAMAAHTEIINVVEIGHSCRDVGSKAPAKPLPPQHQTRAAHSHARPEKVIPFPKAFKPFHQRSAAKLRASIDHHLGRFTCGMRINDPNGGIVSHIFEIILAVFPSLPAATSCLVEKRVTLF
jgi:hypothetical protein